MRSPLSFLSQRFENPFREPGILGVEYVCGTGNDSMHYTLLAQKKKKIEAIGEGHALAPETFFSETDHRCPVHLCISGRGILHRKLNGKPGEAHLLEQVLPNANPDELYVQYSETSPGKVFVSVARKKTVDEIIDRFLHMRYRLLSCSLGPFAVGGILPFMQLRSTVQETLYLDGSSLDIISGQVDSFGPSQEKPGVYTVGSDPVKGEQLVSFAAGMQHYTGYALQNTVARINEYREDHRQEKIFRLAGTAAILLLIVLAVASLLATSHYTSANSILASELAGRQSRLQYYDTLQKNLAEKRAFLESTGLLESSRVSYYADQLAQDLSPGIRLRKMNINPAAKKMNEDREELEFHNRLISVTGLCGKSNELNEWIKRVKSKKWVQAVTLMQFNQEKASEAGVFTINIHLNAP